MRVWELRLGGGNSGFIEQIQKCLWRYLMKWLRTQTVKWAAWVWIPALPLTPYVILDKLLHGPGPVPVVGTHSIKWLNVKHLELCLALHTYSLNEICENWLYNQNTSGISISVGPLSFGGKSSLKQFVFPPHFFSSVFLPFPPTSEHCIVLSLY